MSQVSALLTEIRRQSQLDVKIAGPSEIAGEVRVQGSKNAANKLIAVTIALPGIYKIQNFPFILDPLELLSIVEMLGGSVHIGSDNTVSIDTTHIENQVIPYALTKTTTGAFGFAGALLGRFGRVTIGKPGGDNIGPRPVDLHSDGLRALGADIHESDELLEGRLDATPEDKSFRFRMPSTGAAVNVALAAAASGGRVSLENTPVDGDMDAMYQLMQKAGVAVATQKDGVYIDASGFRVSGRAIDFTCSPDRNDAFTWLAYGALSKQGLRISDVPLQDMEPGLRILKRLNVQLSQLDDDTLMVKAPPPNATLPKGTRVIAGLAREFHSDWAPFLEVVLTTMHGHCQIVDTLFSNRVRQAELLQEMGADIHISGGLPPKDVRLHFSTDPKQARYIINVTGPTPLAPIFTDVGYDVRACAAMVMAASQASGTSTLSNIQALYRGYENIVERLTAIGLAVTAR